MICGDRDGEPRSRLSASIQDIPRRMRHAGLSRNDGSAPCRTPAYDETDREHLPSLRPRPVINLKMLMDAIFGPENFGTKLSGNARMRRG